MRHMVLIQVTGTGQLTLKVLREDQVDVPEGSGILFSERLPVPHLLVSLPDLEVFHILRPFVEKGMEAVWAQRQGRGRDIFRHGDPNP